MTLAVIYNYFEEGREKDTHINYAIFMTYGYYPELDYYIVINGNCTIDLIEKPNVYYYYRENIGFDFGAYGHVLNKIELKYVHYFFINSSVRGPFIPIYSKTKWYEPFVDMIKDNVKL